MNYYSVVMAFIFLTWSFVIFWIVYQARKQAKELGKKIKK